jgi:hypothetical protein
MCRYQSTVGGSYQAVEIIETFVNYMENLERCICLVYDTTSTTTGGLGVKAIRLAESFVEAYREGSLTIAKLRAKSLTWRDVFVEIPVAVRNTPMAAAVMAEVAIASGATQQDFDRWLWGWWDGVYLHGFTCTSVCTCCDASTKPVFGPSSPFFSHPNAPPPPNHPPTPSGSPWAWAMCLRRTWSSSTTAWTTW